MKKWLSIASAVASLALLGGCGNGDSSIPVVVPTVPPPQTSDSPQGTLSNIPIGTKSVRVTLRNSLTGSDVSSKLLTVTASSNGMIPPLSLSFPSLHVGTYQAVGVAYPDDAGTENPIAFGSISTQVALSQTVALNIPLALTLDKLAVAPGNVTLSPYSNQVKIATLTATLTDLQNRALKYPLTWFSSHTEIATVTVSGTTPATATITGISEGTTDVTVVEPNSGKSATVKVTVRIGN